MSRILDKAVVSGLDPSFADGGVLTLPFPEVEGKFPLLVQALPEEKLLLVYTEPSNGLCKIARLDPSGKIDNTFGKNGVVDIPFVKGMSFSPGSINLLESDGWIITGRAVPDSIFDPESLAVVRMNAEGALDSAFGVDGIVILKIEELGDSKKLAKARLVSERVSEKVDAKLPGSLNLNVFSAVEPFGSGSKERILLSSSLTFGFDDIQGIVLRLDETGVLDKSFNEAGYLLIDIPGVNYLFNYARGVVVQSDRKIVVCGYFDRGLDVPSEAFVIRYNEDGTVDSQYGPTKNGVVNISDPDERGSLFLSRLYLKKDGGVLAVGGESVQLASKSLMINLNETGSYNLVFNNGEPLIEQLVIGHVWGSCVVQSDGKIVATGGTGDLSIRESRGQLVARYLPSGKLDGDFGDGQGHIEFNYPEGEDLLRSTTYMEDNRVVTGTLVISDAGDISGFVLRFLG